MLRLSILPTLLLLGTLFSANYGDPMPVRRRPDPPRPMEECITNGRDVETFVEAPELVAKTWKECSQMCREMTECTHWVWRSDVWNKIPGNLGTKNACYRKVSSGKLTGHGEGLVTGDRNCGASDECAGRSDGESFLSSDGCNTCFCSNGMAACTMMMCPPVVESINCKEDEEHLPNDPLCCRKKNDHSAIYCA